MTGFALFIGELPIPRHLQEMQAAPVRTKLSFCRTFAELILTLQHQHHIRCCCSHIACTKSLAYCGSISFSAPCCPGRRSLTPGVLAALELAFRNNEMVKLRVHDQKDAKRANLPVVTSIVHKAEQELDAYVIWRSGRSVSARNTKSEWVHAVCNPQPLAPYNLRQMDVQGFGCNPCSTLS